MTSQTTIRCTICGPEAIDSLISECPDDAAHREFVRSIMADQMSETEHWTIHVDVCPDCNTPTTWHGLDAPGHCRHGFERRVPVKYVPAEQHQRAEDALREAIAAARNFNRGGMTWQEYDAELVRLERIANAEGQ